MESAHRTTPAIPVVIANPSPWSQRFVQDCFGLREGFRLVEDAGPPEGLLMRCLEVAPCVAIIDEETVNRYDAGAFASLVDFGRQVQVLMWSRAPNDRVAIGALRRGCMGLLGDDVTPAVVRKAVRAAARGEIWAERRILTRVIQQLLFATRVPRLTPREREILELIARGHKNRAIAELLDITHETVRWHIRSLHAKLGIEDRLGTAVYARQFLEEGERKTG